MNVCTAKLYGDAVPHLLWQYVNRDRFYRAEEYRERAFQSAMHHARLAWHYAHLVLEGDVPCSTPSDTFYPPYIPLYIYGRTFNYHASIAAGETVYDRRED